MNTWITAATHAADDAGADPGARPGADDHCHQEHGLDLDRRDEERRAEEDPHGIADVQSPGNQLVRRVPAQLEQRRDLRVVPDAERVEEARHATDHDVAAGRADGPAVPARRNDPGDNDGDLDGRETGIDDYHCRRHEPPAAGVSACQRIPGRWRA
jgi:hypothetical protein